MMRPTTAAWLGLLAIAGCDNGQRSTPPAAGQEAVVPGPLVVQTWPVRMAQDQARAPFEAHPGWADLVMKRDYPSALASFSGEKPLPLGQARVHTEFSAAYRQAARVAALAMIEEYGELRRDEDPDAVDCLLGFSEALLARVPEATGHLGRCRNTGNADLEKSAKAWANWVSAGSSWPPEFPLSATPGVPSEPHPGGLPDAGVLPPYTFKDKVEGRDVPLAHPGTLLALALYHERAAEEAAPGSAPVIRILLDPWRLPIEPQAIKGGPEPAAVDDAFLFGTPMLTGADAVFLAAIGGGEGVQAAKSHASESPLAAAVEGCVDLAKPAVDTGCVLSRAEGVYTQLLQAMQIKSGQELGFHKPFAAMGRLGVIRAGEALAAAAGDENAMGLIRLNGIDFSSGSSAEPAYLLAVTAWDAGNRNTLRATELLHAQVGRLPGVEVARYPLDALQVRVGRESAPGLPMN